MSSSTFGSQSQLTCAPCVSRTVDIGTCKQPIWKEDLFYTGHSQVPTETVSNTDGLGTCCCEKTPDPPCCNYCSSCPISKGLSWDVRQLFQTSSLKTNISKYKEKVKGKGICSIV
ncbi:unnamed protein product [Arctia plantaginis]|uniref:Uncharacterized protein n=1 Tax=Arctia plantaginis TaxID=874455 RepID=A0A8S0ZVY1_ARCPL|nr:unnamed protein product [Arctia plantaginis]CAB3262158.1 unnamed protein product [Arctia plantaginis]